MSRHKRPKHRAGAHGARTADAAPQPAAAAAAGGADSTPAPVPPASTPHVSRVALEPVPAWIPRVVALPTPRVHEDGSPGSAFERIFEQPLGRLATLLAYFTAAEARPLRLVCRAAEAHVAAHAWADATTPVVDLGKWRSCFPFATSVKLSPTAPLSPTTSPALSGVSAVDAAGLSNAASLDALRSSGVLRSLKAVQLDGCPQSFLAALVADDAVAPAVCASAFNALTKPQSLATLGPLSTQWAMPAADVTDADAAPITTPLSLLPAVTFSLTESVRADAPLHTIKPRLHLLAVSPWVHQKEASRLIAGAGGVYRAMTCLHAFRGDAKVVTLATQLLHRMLDVPTTAKGMVQTGPSLLVALDAHASDPAVVAPACEVLSALPQLMPGAVIALLAVGAPRILLRALAACVTDANSVRSVVKSLFSLGEEERHRERAVADVLSTPGALNTLFAALAAHATDITVAKPVAHFLAQLSFGGACQAIGAAMYTGGGVSAVVAAVDAADSEALLEDAIILLHCAVHFVDAEEGVDVHPLIEAGAVRAAVAGFHTSPSFACDVLGLLLKRAPELMPQLLTDYPLIATVAAALPAATAPKLPHLLQKLLVWTDAVHATRCQLAQPPVVAALVSCLHRVKGEAVCCVITLLFEAAGADAAGVAAAASGAVVKALTAAIKARDGAVIQKCFSLLGECATRGGADAVAALVASGGVPAIVAGLNVATLSARGARLGGLLLVEVVTVQPAAVACTSAGGALLALARTHSDNAYALRALHAAAVEVAALAPPAFSGHVGGLCDLADEALASAVSTRDYEAAERGLVSLSSLLRCGGPPREVAAAVKKLRGVFTEVEAVLRADMEGPPREDELWELLELLEGCRIVKAAVVSFAASHPKLAGQLSGW